MLYSAPSAISSPVDSKRIISAERIRRLALDPWRIVLLEMPAPLSDADLHLCCRTRVPRFARRKRRLWVKPVVEVTFALFIARWAAIDRRSRSFSVPFEFDAFVFFAWVLVVPYYLLKTRGPRGLISAMGFWALAITPTVVSQVILLTRRFT